MGILTKIVYVGSGWYSVRLAAREFRRVIVVPFHFFGWLVVLIKDLRDQAAEDRKLAELDSKLLWDMMVRDYSITTSSVRRKYRIAEWVNTLLILIIALSIGFVLANYEFGDFMVVANILFINMLLLCLFQNAYRLNMAYTQSAPPVQQFLKSVLRKPMLLVARPLPKDYQVGVRTKA
jgi:hypothetical protein